MKQTRRTFLASYHLWGPVIDSWECYDSDGHYHALAWVESTWAMLSAYLCKMIYLPSFSATSTMCWTVFWSVSPATSYTWLPAILPYLLVIALVVVLAEAVVVCHPFAGKVEGVDVTLNLLKGCLWVCHWKLGWLTLQNHTFEHYRCVPQQMFLHHDIFYAQNGTILYIAFIGLSKFAKFCLKLYFHEETTGQISDTNCWRHKTHV